MKKIIEKTNGKKTTSTAVVYLAFQIIKALFPELTNGNEELIENGIVILFSTGIFHKIWRNRKSILDWIRNLFKPKQ